MVPSVEAIGTPVQQAQVSSRKAVKTLTSTAGRQRYSTSMANHSVHTANRTDSSVSKTSSSMEGLLIQLAAGCSLGEPAVAACEV